MIFETSSKLFTLTNCLLSSDQQTDPCLQSDLNSLLLHQSLHIVLTKTTLTRQEKMQQLSLTLIHRAPLAVLTPSSSFF